MRMPGVVQFGGGRAGPVMTAATVDSRGAGRSVGGDGGTGIRKNGAAVGEMAAVGTVSAEAAPVQVAAGTAPAAGVGR